MIHKIYSEVFYHTIGHHRKIKPLFRLFAPFNYNFFKIGRQIYIRFQGINWQLAMNEVTCGYTMFMKVLLTAGQVNGQV